MIFSLYFWRDVNGKRNNDCKRNAGFINFFYFGFTLDEDFDSILDRIVEKAYKDATNQGAFNVKADSEKAQLTKYGESGSKQTIIKRIKLLCENDYKFDEWHKETCDELIKIYKENDLKELFTYGNAQKWVNMSLKYIYLLGGISGDYAQHFKEKISKIREYESKLHIPIDSYIIDALWELKDIPLPFKDGVEKDREKEYKTPSDYIEGWSNWSFEEYYNVINKLREALGDNTIKWESEVWIKQAKERKR